MNKDTNEQLAVHHTVIIGGGFGGLYAAKALRKAPLRLTLIDKRNFHLFQPLLYQVATGGLSPGDIASPLRGVLKRQENITVLAGEVIDIDPELHVVKLRDGQIHYDSLIVATGAGYTYFGNEQWVDAAPSLKTIEDALDIRRRILLAFETAEREPDPQKRKALLTFVIVGGGPTGVELAGAIGELANNTLRHEFRRIDPSEAQIIVLEMAERILGSYPADLSAKAEKSLDELGVTVRTNTALVEIDEDHVMIRAMPDGDKVDLPASTVLWAAGVKASPLGHILSEQTGAELDRLGRVKVEADLTLAGYPEIFVIGDLARVDDTSGNPLPGMAPVAMQQGEYAARLIERRLSGKTSEPFSYHDKGTLAVIGRNSAVATLGPARLSGFPAWLIWVFIHIGYLIGFDNKLMVLMQWAWNYFTRNRGARLITGADPFPLIETESEKDFEPSMAPVLK
ncbi:MAG: NAD(P)/FAD-dependent oxidoreductase [Candidatus Promineifilaceae bacterium]|nr:NAD(P)/FAD-dependent oxidoreductase [Candidatus Promineifilaceae bacterium]